MVVRTVGSPDAPSMELSYCKILSINIICAIMAECFMLMFRLKCDQYDFCIKI